MYNQYGDQWSDQDPYDANLYPEHDPGMGTANMGHSNMGYPKMGQPKMGYPKTGQPLNSSGASGSAKPLSNMSMHSQPMSYRPEHRRMDLSRGREEVSQAPSRMDPQREDTYPPYSSHSNPQREDTYPPYSSHSNPQREDTYPPYSSHSNPQREDTYPPYSSHSNPHGEDNYPPFSSNRNPQSEDNYPAYSSNINPQREQRESTFPPYSGHKNPQRESTFPPYSSHKNPQREDSYPPYSGHKNPQREDSYPPYSSHKNPQREDSYPPYSSHKNPQREDSYPPYSGHKHPQSEDNYPPYSSSINPQREQREDTYPPYMTYPARPPPRAPDTDSGVGESLSWLLNRSTSSVERPVATSSSGFLSSKDGDSVFPQLSNYLDRVTSPPQIKVAKCSADTATSILRQFKLEWTMDYTMNRSNSSEPANRPVPLMALDPKPTSMDADKRLPPPAMMQDYAGVTPRVFPDSCCLCNTEYAHMKEWVAHKNSSLHIAKCQYLRELFPEWDGEIPIRMSLRRKETGSGQHRAASPLRSASLSESTSPQRKRQRQRSPERTTSPVRTRHLFPVLNPHLHRPDSHSRTSPKAPEPR
uniref:C2H2-type domain-containing protein n=1 Tax=Knipowitschia caucasica TaxID=637954 RepID=A0AAV2KNH8_KNICA